MTGALPEDRDDFLLLRTIMKQSCFCIRLRICIRQCWEFKMFLFETGIPVNKILMLEVLNLKLN